MQPPRQPLDTSRPLLIKPSIRKLAWLVVLLGAMLVMPLGALPGIAGWLGTIVLAPMFVLALYIYRPGANFLRLHADGLDIATAGRKRTIDWADVAGFHLAGNGRDKNIGILYRHDPVTAGLAPLPRPPDTDVEWIRDLYVVPLEDLCGTLNDWAAERSAAAPRREGTPGIAPHLPANATDADLLAFVDGWASLLEREDYAAAFAYTAHDPYAGWSPDLIRAVIKGYGEADPAQKVTLAGAPTDIQQRKEVDRWHDAGSGSRAGRAGEIWYDLNIDGLVSDLTATFSILENADGLVIVLEQIHVM